MIRASPRSPAAPAQFAPRFIVPQVPTAVEKVPTGEDWLHEIQYDGHRCVAYVDGNGAKPISRTIPDWSTKFSRIAEALVSMSKGRTMVLDGEIAASDERGVTHGLQDVLLAPPDRLAYFVFDLLWFGGEDMRNLPLLTRKTRLKSLLMRTKPPIVYVDHSAGTEAGCKMFDLVLGMGGEGILSKRKAARYFSGRSSDWLRVTSVEARARRREAVQKSDKH